MGRRNGRFPGMNHLYDKATGRHVGSSIHPVDNNTVGHTPIAPVGDEDTWDGEKWVERPAPKTISRRQAKQQLVIAGLDEAAAAAIDAIEDPIERKLVRIWFDDADHWERDNEWLLALAEKLGLGEAEIDELFAAAGEL